MTSNLHDMSPAPSVRCTGCGYSWYSATSVDGLRVLGSCPKCSGELAFREEAGHEDRFDAVSPAETAPHLVLGIPRR